MTAVDPLTPREGRLVFMRRGTIPIVRSWPLLRSRHLLCGAVSVIVGLASLSLACGIARAELALVDVTESAGIDYRHRSTQVGDTMTGGGRGGRR